MLARSDGMDVTWQCQYIYWRRESRLPSVTKTVVRRLLMPGQIGTSPYYGLKLAIQGTA